MQIRATTILLAIGLAGTAAAQETPEQSCGKIMEYYTAGDIEGALEEAQWCLEALQQVKQGQESEFFRSEVGGWQRTSLEKGNALGFAVTEAGYQKDGKTLTVSLIGNSGGANSLGGFLGGLAQAGLAAAGTRMRIQQHAAVATTESGSNTLMVTLDTGGQLQFESSEATPDELSAFAEAFPITELDESRR
jgi:hypothetical protein